MVSVQTLVLVGLVGVPFLALGYLVWSTWPSSARRVFRSLPLTSLACAPERVPVRNFLLNGETGVAEVLTEGNLRLVNLSYDRQGSERLLVRDVPDELARYMLARGVDMGDADTRLRYEEGVFEEGELVTVGGRGRWVADSAQRGRGYRDVGRRFIEALEDGRLFASDDPDLARP